MEEDNHPCNQIRFWGSKLKKQNIITGKPEVEARKTTEMVVCLFTFDEKSKINNQLVKKIKVKFFSIILSVEVVFCRFYYSHYIWLTYLKNFWPAETFLAISQKVPQRFWYNFRKTFLDSFRFCGMVWLSAEMKFVL